MKPAPPETQAIRNKKRQRRDRWLRERQRGFLSYVLRRGVLAWGVPMALFFIDVQWGKCRRFSILAKDERRIEEGAEDNRNKLWLRGIGNNGATPHCGQSLGNGRR